LARRLRRTTAACCAITCCQPSVSGRSARSPARRSSAGTPGMSTPHRRTSLDGPRGILTHAQRRLHGCCLASGTWVATGSLSKARSSLLHPWIVRWVGVHGRATVIDGLRATFVVPSLVARRSGTARTRRRARTATRRHRRARCRPRRPTREQTCWGWPPIAWLPLLSRTSRSPHGVVLPGTPGNASRYRRRARPRRLRHQLQPGAEHRGALDQRWLHPESRRRRPSCRRGRHRQPRPAHHGAHCDDGRRVVRPWRARTPPGARTPSRAKTPANRSRELRRAPR
jgi:hypothetical protein